MVVDFWSVGSVLVRTTKTARSRSRLLMDTRGTETNDGDDEDEDVWD